MDRITRRALLAAAPAPLLAACSPATIEAPCSRPHVPHSQRSAAYRPSPQELVVHEGNMREAIRMARTGSPSYPFGAVIVRASDNALLAEGVNNGGANPMWHGEVVALNDYVAKHGNAGWSETTLYTTGEPCAMCMAAMAWCKVPRVVWASSIATIRASAEGQIDLAAVEVAARAEEIYEPEYLLGGVLARETDLLFARRPR